MKTIFTTGQVAKICKVAPRTVSTWFDSGRLRGYRVPGSLDRRIPRAELLKFLKKYGMPLDELEELELKILLVTQDLTLIDKVRRPPVVTVRTAEKLFEAGMYFAEMRPTCVVIDLPSTQLAEQIATMMRKHASHKCVIILLKPEELRGETFSSELFDDQFNKPFDMDLLFHTIKTLTGVNDV